jgi:flavin-dependent thymidylate synthase
VVPVWADPTLARDEGNLTTLCGKCHREIAGRELEFVGRLGGTAARTRWEPRPRFAWNKLTVTRLVRIERFEYVGVKETYDLEVEGPYHNFVANGIVTHNSVNEYSGRYSLMPLLFYRPEQTQVAAQSEANRQGRDVEGVSDDVYRLAVERWEEARAAAADAYEWLLAEDVARELARIDLPLSTYTQWYWKIDLHNLIHFLTLRVDPHAQWEIQQFGRVMAGMLKRVAPLSYEAWIDYQVCGSRVSHGELEALRRLLEVRDGGLAARAEADPLGPEELAEVGLSKREVRELLDKLEPMERPDFELDVGALRTPEEFEERLARAVPGDFE